jgi:CBS domain-containing protein
MNAADMMTSNVLTIGADASVHDAAWVMLTNRVSALPVVDARGRLVGIVSEGDLLHRADIGTEPRRSHLSEFVTDSETLAAEFVKSHGRKVADVMTCEVVTASPDMAARDIADLMDRHSIKRVPVVEHGRVIGIVSRADFLTALTGAWQRGIRESQSDEALRTSVVDRIRTMPWIGASILNIEVHGGQVDVTGIVGSDAQKRAVRVAVEETPGVRAVEDNVKVQSLARY